MEDTPPRQIDTPTEQKRHTPPGQTDRPPSGQTDPLRADRQTPLRADRLPQGKALLLALTLVRCRYTVQHSSIWIVFEGVTAHTSM